MSFMTYYAIKPHICNKCANMRNKFPGLKCIITVTMINCTQIVLVIANATLYQV